MCGISNKFTYVWRLRLVFTGAAASFVCGVLSIFSRLPALLLLYFIIILLAVIFFYLPALQRSFLYEINAGYLKISYGVFFYKHIVFPVPRLIYTRIKTTPLYKMFGLYCVVLIGCGIRTVIPAVTKKQALHLVEKLHTQSAELK